MCIVSCRPRNLFPSLKELKYMMKMSILMGRVGISHPIHPYFGKFSPKKVFFFCFFLGGGGFPYQKYQMITWAPYILPYGVTKLHLPILWENIYKLVYRFFTYFWLGFIALIHFYWLLLLGLCTFYWISSTWFASQVKVTGQPIATVPFWSPVTAIVKVIYSAEKTFIAIWNSHSNLPSICLHVSISL